MNHIGKPRDPALHGQALGWCSGAVCCQEHDSTSLSPFPHRMRTATVLPS